MSEFKQSLQELIDLTNSLSTGMDKLSGSVNKAKEATQSAANTTKAVNRAKKETVDVTSRVITREELEAEKARLVSRERTRQIQAMARADAQKKGLISTTKRYNRTLNTSRMIMNQFRGMLLQTFGAYAIISGIRNTINTIAEFEQSMARVRAISGATEEEFQRLSDAAKSIASEGSIFDPKTIADLQVELAKLGFAASEIVTATRPIVNLATATGEDLTRAAEVAASTLRAFNLDASAMAATIDVMAKSFTTSALDMSRWAEGAKYAAPVASQLGWNVEQLASVMGVLANRQIFGSLAGTSFRNIMIEMSDTSSDLSQALGLTSTDFGEFIDKLEQANDEGLDFARIVEILPRRATTAGLLIAKNTQEIREMEIAMNAASGAVAEMASIQLDTVTGEVRQLGAAWKAMVSEMDEGDGIISSSIKKYISNLREGIRLLTLARKFGPWVSLSLPATLDKIRDEGFERYRDIIADVSEEIRGLRGVERALESQKLYFERAVDLIPDIVRYNNTVSESADQSAKLETRLSVLNALFSDLINKSTSTVRGFSVDVLEKEYDKVEKIIIDLNEEIDKLKKQDEERLSAGLDAYDKSAREQLEKTLEAYVLYFKILDNELNIRGKSEKDKNEKARREEYNRQKSHLALQRKLEIDAINANQQLSDEQREKELEEIRKHFDERGFILEKNFTEDVELRKLYNKLIEVNKDIHEKNMLDINKKYDAQHLSELRSNMERKVSIHRQINQAELNALRQQLRELRREEHHSYDKRFKQAQDIAELQYQIEKKTIKNQIEITKMRLKHFEDVIQKAEKAGLDDDLESAKHEAELLKAALEELEKNLDAIGRADVKLDKKLHDYLGFDKKEWNNIITLYGLAENAVKSWAQSSVDAARDKVNASNTAVAELQRDLDTEIRLAEQGFASNVSLKRKELEEERRVREERLKEQEKAQKRQASINAALDAANILTSIINILADETSKKGWYGLITGALAAGAIYALYSDWKSSSQNITKYEKGGWEKLKGNSHRSGGIPLGEGREAEGGEMLAIFNKKATSKYGKQIAEMTDLINKDKLGVDMDTVLKASGTKPVVVNVDNRKLSDVHSVLKQIRDDGIYYSGGYKIVKKGNRTRKIKIDAV